MILLCPSRVYFGESENTFFLSLPSTECAIVRIMKARRQMRHQDLVVELMKQVGPTSCVMHLLQDLGGGGW